MQSIQHLLTTAIVVLCVTMTTTIVLDSCIFLTQLWNNVAANKVCSFQKIYPQPDNENKPEPQLAAIELTTMSISATDLSTPTISYLAPNVKTRTKRVREYKTITTISIEF